MSLTASVLWIASFGLGFIPAQQEIVAAPATRTATAQGVTTTERRPEDLTPQERQRIRKAWRDYLTNIAKRENATLFFDVSDDAPPPSGAIAGASGAPTMRNLALVTGRKWRQQNGVQAFARLAPNQDRDDINATVLWARTLSQTQQKALVDGELGLGQVDPGQRERLLRMMARIDADLAASLLDRGDSVGVGLRLVSEISFTDPATGKTVTRALGSNTGQREIVVPTSAGKSVAEPLENSPVGPLDFGDGDVLSLYEILEKARAAFRTRYTADDRIRTNAYFVCGKFDKKAFEMLLKEIVSIPPVEIRPVDDADTDGSRALLDVLRDELLTHSIDAGETLSENPTTIDELRKNRPGLVAQLDRLGLPPGTPLRLRAGLSLALQGRGFYVPGGATASANGRPVGLASPARGAFRLR